jgi:hypothetical protein
MENRCHVAPCTRSLNAFSNCNKFDEVRVHERQKSSHETTTPVLLLSAILHFRISHTECRYRISYLNRTARCPFRWQDDLLLYWERKLELSREKPGPLVEQGEIQGNSSSDSNLQLGIKSRYSCILSQTSQTRLDRLSSTALHHIFSILAESGAPSTFSYPLPYSPIQLSWFRHVFAFINFSFILIFVDSRRERSLFDDIVFQRWPIYHGPLSRLRIWCEWEIPITKSHLVSKWNLKLTLHLQISRSNDSERLSWERHKAMKVLFDEPVFVLLGTDSEASMQS